MSDRHPHDAAPARLAGHGWLMIACCIPMLVIAITLVVTGVASGGLVFGAIGCTVMMALMMRGMGHGGGQAGESIRASHDRSDRR